MTPLLGRSQQSRRRGQPLRGPLQSSSGRRRPSPVPDVGVHYVRHPAGAIDESWQGTLPTMPITRDAPTMDPVDQMYAA